VLDDPGHVSRAAPDLVEYLAERARPQLGDMMNLLTFLEIGSKMAVFYQPA
jgi:hypothetical protein